MADAAALFTRWSRLKQAARRPPAEAPRAAPQAEATLPEAPAPAELPSIESLTAESDFSPFMRADVPEALRNAALQKLWRSDPLYANLDGLLEYGEDYAAMVSDTAVVRTVYRVLQGMPDGKEPAAPPPAAEASTGTEAGAADGANVPSATDASAAAASADGEAPHET
jgi:hypothetical protein